MARHDGSEISPQESRRLATGLIAYGALGLALAIAMVIAVFWLDGAFDDVQRDVSVQVDAVERTLASGVIDTRVGQGFAFLRAAIIALTVWLALPALAALLIGLAPPRRRAGRASVCLMISPGSCRAAAA